MSGNVRSCARSKHCVCLKHIYIIPVLRDCAASTTPGVATGCQRCMGAQHMSPPLSMSKRGAGDGSVSAAEGEGGAGRRLTFSDKDEHMYFWFPLLAGLSELTFDPRQDIRYSALEARSSACAIPNRSLRGLLCAQFVSFEVSPSKCVTVAGPVPRVSMCMATGQACCGSCVPCLNCALM